MKQLIILIIISLVTTFNLFAKENVSKKDTRKEIKGAVTDEFGEPLAGVIVACSQSEILVVTDSDGKYSISIPEDSLLVFRFLDAKSDTISTSYRAIVNYKLIVGTN